MNPDETVSLIKFAKCQQEGSIMKMLEDLLKDDVYYVTPACKEEKQKKLLRDGFARAGVAMNSNWKPVSISFKNTDQAINDIQKALEESE
ncbi:hypothetical protein B1H10_06860 [candidate division KSB1 bacterium 4484_188]|nr:MAG: hypothetical protein B1H10_06860 [candidate division KSB1 bacterium 4484_188]